MRAGIIIINHIEFTDGMKITTISNDWLKIIMLITITLWTRWLSYWKLESTILRPVGDIRWFPQSPAIMPAIEYACNRMACIDVFTFPNFQPVFSAGAWLTRLHKTVGRIRFYCMLYIFIDTQTHTWKENKADKIEHIATDCLNRIGKFTYIIISTCRIVIQR